MNTTNDERPGPGGYRRKGVTPLVASLWGLFLIAGPWLVTSANEQVAGTKSEVVMARVNRDSITVDEFMAFLAADTSRLPRAKTAKGKGLLLRDMIAERLIKADLIANGQLASDAGQQEFIDTYLEMVEERFSPAAEPSVEELRTYYEANRDEFGIPESVRLSQIKTVFPDDPTRYQRADAKERAQLALKRLNDGEAFAEVAREMTEHPGKKGTDGDLGFVWRHGNEWLENALEGLNVGEYTEVLESKNAYNIIFLAEHRDSIITPFEDSVDEVRARLIKAETTAARDAYVNALAKEAEIDLILDELKEAYPGGLFSQPALDHP